MGIFPDVGRLLDYVSRLVSFNEATALLAWLWIVLGLARLSVREGRLELWAIIQRYADGRGNWLFWLLPAGLALLYVR